jgi:hypothetical protein
MLQARNEVRDIILMQGAQTSEVMKIGFSFYNDMLYNDRILGNAGYSLITDPGIFVIIALQA